MYLSRKVFFSPVWFIFCHISELKQLAGGVPCLGFTTDRLSHTALPELIGNASEEGMSKMLSAGRSSDSYFWKTSTWSLEKRFGVGFGFVGFWFIFSTWVLKFIYGKD